MEPIPILPPAGASGSPSSTCLGHAPTYRRSSAGSCLRRPGGRPRLRGALPQRRTGGRLVGPETYKGIAEAGGERLHQFGEWLFSYAAVGDVRPRRTTTPSSTRWRIWRDVTGGGREEIAPCAAKSCPVARPLCGGRRLGVLRRRRLLLDLPAEHGVTRHGPHPEGTLPRAGVVYGGANFDGEMGEEYLRQLPWIDHVVTGEGDIAFPALLHRIAAGDTAGVPGVRPGG